MVVNFDLHSENKYLPKDTMYYLYMYANISNTIHHATERTKGLRPHIRMLITQRVLGNQFTSKKQNESYASTTICWRMSAPADPSSV